MIRVAISVGELLDKISILEIKDARIDDLAKLANVRTELEELRDVRRVSIDESDALRRAVRRLRRVNEALWNIEDAIRQHERRRDFGARFVELARSVYVKNDERAALKREINTLSGSPLTEEKSYAVY